MVSLLTTTRQTSAAGGCRDAPIPLQQADGNGVHGSRVQLRRIRPVVLRQRVIRCRDRKLPAGDGFLRILRCFRCPRPNGQEGWNGMIEMLERLKELVHCTPSCNSRWRENHPCDCEAREAQMLIQ